MNTLTIGGTAAGKTHSLGQRYRQARKDGAVVWSYATGGNARYPHFEGAEWSVTDDHLAEMLKMALGAVIARAESGPGQWGPVRILIDDPEIDFYEREPGETLTALARTGSANGVEIHLTVSPGHLDFMPGDLRAQFYEVDLREETNPAPEFETGETNWLTVTGETTREAVAALSAAIAHTEDSTGLEVEMTGVNVDHSGARLTAFYDLFMPSTYAPGVIV